MRKKSIILLAVSLLLVALISTCFLSSKRNPSELLKVKSRHSHLAGTWNHISFSRKGIFWRS